MNQFMNTTTPQTTLENTSTVAGPSPSNGAPIEKTTPPELDNPLDELLKLIPDDHKATASKLIAQLTGLATKRSPGSAAMPGSGMQPPPEKPVDRAHLRQDPARSDESALAPKKNKAFII